jgi:hypothetical protein
MPPVDDGRQAMEARPNGRDGTMPAFISLSFFADQAPHLRGEQVVSRALWKRRAKLNGATQ